MRGVGRPRWNAGPVAPGQRTLSFTVGYADAEERLDLQNGESDDDESDESSDDE